MTSSNYSVPPPPPPPGKAAPGSKTAAIARRSSAAKLCAYCMASTPDEDMVESQGRRICKKCAEAIAAKAAVPADPEAPAATSEAAALAKPPDVLAAKPANLPVGLIVKYALVGVVVLAAAGVIYTVTRDPFGRDKQHPLGQLTLVEKQLAELGMIKRGVLVQTKKDVEAIEKASQQPGKQELQYEDEGGFGATLVTRKPQAVTSNAALDQIRAEELEGFEGFWLNEGKYHLYSEDEQDKYAGFVLVFEDLQGKVRGAAAYWACADLSAVARTTKFAERYWEAVSGAEPVLIDRESLEGPSRFGSFTTAAAVGMWLKRNVMSRVQVLQK